LRHGRRRLALAVAAVPVATRQGVLLAGHELG